MAGRFTSVIRIAVIMNDVASFEGAYVQNIAGINISLSSISMDIEKYLELLKFSPNRSGALNCFYAYARNRNILEVELATVLVNDGWFRQGLIPLKEGVFLEEFEKDL